MQASLTCDPHCVSVEPCNRDDLHAEFASWNSVSQRLAAVFASFKEEFEIDGQDAITVRGFGSAHDDKTCSPIPPSVCPTEVSTIDDTVDLNEYECESHGSIDCDVISDAGSIGSNGNLSDEQFEPQVRHLERYHDVGTMLVAAITNIGEDEYGDADDAFVQTFRE